jgi:hypothetical protein
MWERDFRFRGFLFRCIGLAVVFLALEGKGHPKGDREPASIAVLVFP